MILCLTNPCFEHKITMLVRANIVAPLFSIHKFYILFCLKNVNNHCTLCAPCVIAPWIAPLIIAAPCVIATFDNKIPKTNNFEINLAASSVNVPRLRLQTILNVKRAFRSFLCRSTGRKHGQSSIRAEQLRGLNPGGCLAQPRPEISPELTADIRPPISFLVHVCEERVLLGVVNTVIGSSFHRPCRGKPLSQVTL